MTLPTNSDYQGIIQHPSQCFSDFELKLGVPQLNNWGMPKAITGNFAAVFSLNCNGKKYAVKCFTRRQPDQEERYAAISTHLSGLKLPYMVDFKFLRRGILLQGNWYPVVKMEWLEGDTLGTYVDKHSRDPQALRQLALGFISMSHSLQSHSIAHGDLQHGNILVVDDQIRLVDYDGMYVPLLHKKEASESGHPNYQHPIRQKQFGPFLDTFSIWVIYLSLLALSIEPNLRSRLKLDEECLLFRKADFLYPETSEALRALDHSPDADIRRLATSFLSLVYSTDLSHFPSVEQALDSPIAASLVQPQAEAFSQNPPQHPAASAADSWIFDHQPVPENKSLPKVNDTDHMLCAFSLAAGMIVLGVSGMAVNFALDKASSILFALAGALFFIVQMIATLGLLFGRFLALDVVKQKLRAQRNHSRLKFNVTRLEKWNLRAFHTRQKRLEQKSDHQGKSIHDLQQLSIRQERAELSQLGQELYDQKAQIAVHLNELHIEEEQRLALALESFQQEYFKRELRSKTLLFSPIPGISPRVKLRLLLRGGIVSANQVHPGISRQWVNELEASALVIWRQFIEESLENQKPRALPSEQRTRIVERFHKAAERLNRQENELIQRMEKERQACITRHAQYRQDLDQLARDKKQEYATKIQTVGEEINRLTQTLAEKKWQLAQAKRDLEPYRHISFQVYLVNVLKSLFA